MTTRAPDKTALGIFAGTPIRFVDRLRVSRKMAAFCILLAVLMHVPMLPVAGLIGMLKLRTDTEETDEDIDADILPTELAFGEEVAAMKTSPLTEVEVGPEGVGVTPPPPDAGVADALHDAPPDALPDASPDAGRLDAGLDGTEVAEPPPPKPKDSPLEGNKMADAISSEKRYVEIVLVGERLRAHAAGRKMGELLPMIPQWEAFFADSGINPVEDVDLMVLTGSQIRVSGRVTAIITFSAPMERVEEAVSKIVDRAEPKGEWLADAPLKAARAKADGAQRVFALVPEKKALLTFPWPTLTKAQKAKMTPEAIEKFETVEAPKRVNDALRRAKSIKLPSSEADVAIDMFVRDVVKFNDKMPIAIIPETATSMRFSVYPKADEAEVKIVFETKDAASASLEASKLSDKVPGLGMALALSSGIKLPDIVFTAEGKKVVGRATADQAFVAKVLELATKAIEEERARKNKK